jgi:hypothetical protein
MRAILGFHPDRDADAVAMQAFAVSNKLLALLDAPEPGEDGDSLLSEFDDSPQAAADAVLGRGEVWVPVEEALKAEGSLPVDIDAVDKEFM